MASIIPGYEYDIFISYRQKDNKGGRQGVPLSGTTQSREAGWVSDFVEALKDELDSTFKEEISIYFDVNAHDELSGIQNTDAALKKRLKCVVFIPVISYTYCDPKSSVWQNEFKTFVEQASQDRFGLKVRLPDGNVAGRVLPVRIHDIDNEDIKPCELVLGGILRGVEFIYREPGVNRPLTRTDDEKKNLNGTNYRNQINRVANAVYGIFSGLKADSYEPVPAKGKITLPEEKQPVPQNSIAVLPFADVSLNKDQEYFCDGVAEEIINALVHIKGFKVIARTSAFAFKGKQADIREIGRKLNVETVLEGSIRKDRNRLRITVQLIKVADGSNLWSERYDREMKDVFAIQDEISMAIVDNLKIRILGEGKAIISKRYTDNIEAYNLYLKGTHCWQMMTLEGYLKASGYFEQALAKDPRYALAYVGLATVYMFSTTYGDVPPDKAFPKANEYVNEALKIDNTLGGAYSALGIINTFYYWNWTEAERNFRHALQINPNASLIHIYYSCLLTCAGRHEEAISETKRAQELDPLSVFINTFRGVAFAYAGRFDDAINEYRSTLEINTNYFFAHNQLGMSYFGKSMLKEAVAEYEKSVDLSNGNPYATAFLVFSYYLTGKKDQADKLFDSLRKRSETEYVPATSFYLIHFVRREEDLALEWLKKACTEHDTFLPWFKASPMLVHRDSKYFALLTGAGLEENFLKTDYFVS